MKRKFKFVGISLLVVMLFSCTTLGITVKPYSEMTAKEKVTYLFKIYNAQYADYKAMASNPVLSDAQKQVLRTKKAILVQVYPLIQGLDMAMVEGKPLDVALQAQVISLLNQLGASIK